MLKVKGQRKKTCKLQAREKWSNYFINICNGLWARSIAKDKDKDRCGKYKSLHLYLPNKIYKYIYITHNIYITYYDIITYINMYLYIVT